MDTSDTPQPVPSSSAVSRRPIVQGSFSFAVGLIGLFWLVLISLVEIRQG